MAKRPQTAGDHSEDRILKKSPAPAHVADDDIGQDRFAQDMAQMRQQQGALTVVQKEQNERVTALALELNYQGSTDMAVLENSARDAIRRIGMGIFELGGYLLLLKECSEYGEFIPMLERIGVNHQSAKKYMAVTRRFANGSSTNHLEKLGFTKMVELLPLDDSQLDDLADEGQTGELALDDVSRMSVKELRAAVRKERSEAAKQKNRAERQEAVNAELHEEVRLVKRQPPADQLKRLLTEASVIQAETLGMVRGTFRQALANLNDSGEGQQLTMSGMVGQLISELTALRDEFNLPEVGGTPEWEAWSQAQDEQAASK